MPIPFPGMDPWLERPGLWPDVHMNLIIAFQKVLAPLVRPRYYVAVQQRTVVAVVPPDPHPIFPDLSVVQQAGPDENRESSTAVLAQPIIVEVPVQEMIKEAYLEVVEVASQQVITVIEILSHSNKKPGKDRRVYESKRQKIFRTLTHLVEIDLLRDGEPMPFTFLQTNGHMNHYRILVKRGDHWRRAYLYSFNVRDSIPVFPLPLQPGDREPLIRLGEALQKVYDENGYDLRVDYNRPPEPPLSEADMTWAKEIMRASKIAKP
jgi:hypothetical protein